MMAEWDGNESSCSCDCGFDIPKGGTLDGLALNAPLGIPSGGTGANTAAGARNKLGVYSGVSSKITTLSASNPVVASINFGVTFAEAPNVVATPRTNRGASGSYGIYSYISEITTTGCKVQLTTNVPNATSTGELCIEWIAIGEIVT